MGLFGKSETKAAARTGWQITCDETCGFMVRDYDRNELVKVVQLHMVTSHQKTISEADALRLASSAADEV